MLSAAWLGVPVGVRDQQRLGEALVLVDRGALDAEQDRSGQRLGGEPR